MSGLLWFGFGFSVLFLFCVVLSVASPPGGQDDSDTITAVDEVYTKDAVDESRNETADRVASYQADQKVEPVYATRAARRLLRLLRMFFGFIFFLSGFPIIIMKYALLVEPVLGGAFCFCFLFVFHSVACRISGGARPRCVSILPQAWVIFSFPSLVFPCYCKTVPFSRSVPFSRYLCSIFFHFFCSSLFRFSFFFFSFNVSGLLACVCCACRIQYDGMTLHCLLPLLHYDVQSNISVYVVVL